MLTTTKLNLALFLARVPLGAYFAIAGFNKIVGPGGVPGFVEKAKGTVPAGMEQFGVAYLHALPFVELAAGLFVLLGLVVRLNALLMSLMLFSFLIAARQPAYLARIWGEPGKPFDVNFVLLGLALCLTLLGSGEWGTHRVFRRRRRVVVATTTEPAVVTTSRGTPIVGSR